MLVIVEQEPEIILTGGRITSGVVRVGDTARRPIGEHSEFVHRLLRHLEHVGFDGAPRFLGTDANGREILTFLHGDVPTDFMPRDWSTDQVAAAARFLRRLHDATAGAAIAGDAEVVCHNDFSPLNVVFVNGEPAAMFDFDQARPGTRMRDVAYAAWLWLVGADVDGHLDRQLALLRTFCDAYGVPPPARTEFGARIVARVEDERDFHERAGRGASLSWLRHEIEWLSNHTTAIDDGLALSVS